MDEHQERELASVVERYAQLYYLPVVPAADMRAVQSELAGRLMGVVEPLARGAARRAGLVGLDTDHFAAGATLDLIAPRDTVPRICLWSPELGRFEAWVRPVVFRSAVDAQRRLSRRPTAALPDGFELPQPEGQSNFHAVFGGFINAPFPPEDLTRMERWGPRARLELTLLSGYWLKFLLTPTVWEIVQSEYTTARRAQLPTFRLPEPFPPLPFLTAETEGDRADTLSATLGYESKDTLVRNWYRCRKLLSTLKCVAELEACAAGREPP